MDRSPQVQLQEAEVPIQNWVAIGMAVLVRVGTAVGVGFGICVGRNVAVTGYVIVGGAV